MSLETYRKMRDFRATSEPKGRKSRKKGNSFVIQKHDARRLHYDFRLEMDGVLKSWAVTRGPSLIAGEKRLAVHVEDHPLDYGSFEGTIPKGEYGAGTVILWDRGTWQPIGDAAKGYAKGHLEFELSGEKLHGRWHLVRMQTREKRENWLLIKADDEFAQKDGDILKDEPASVSTGRDVAEVKDEAPGWSSQDGPLARGKRAKMPDFVKPMLAQLQSAPPSGPQWLHEIKFDGYRLQARIQGGKARLLTRSGLDWTQKFGDMAKLLAALPVTTAIIDGELVVENDAGASDFSALQADLSDGRSDRFLFYAFDLLYLDGNDLRAEPLTARNTPPYRWSAKTAACPCPPALTAASPRPCKRTCCPMPRPPPKRRCASWPICASSLPSNCFAPHRRPSCPRRPSALARRCSACTTGCARRCRSMPTTGR